MKKVPRITGILLMLIFTWLWGSQPAHAKIEFRELKQLNLDVQPLDIALSGDGNLIFVLSPGEILVYSIPEDTVTGRISVDKGFNRIAFSPITNALILTNSASKAVNLVQVDFIQSIDITGLPFKGPQNAPVTISVFSDYQ